MSSSGGRRSIVSCPQCFLHVAKRPQSLFAALALDPPRCLFFSLANVAVAVLRDERARCEHSLLSRFGLSFNDGSDIVYMWLVDCPLTVRHHFLPISIQHKMSSNAYDDVPLCIRAMKRLRCVDAPPQPGTMPAVSSTDLRCVDAPTQSVTMPVETPTAFQIFGRLHRDARCFFKSLYDTSKVTCICTPRRRTSRMKRMEKGFIEAFSVFQVHSNPRP